MNINLTALINAFYSSSTNCAVNKIAIERDKIFERIKKI